MHNSCPNASFLGISRISSWTGLRSKIFVTLIVTIVSRKGKQQLSKRSPEMSHGPWPVAIRDSQSHSIHAGTEHEGWNFDSSATGGVCGGYRSPGVRCKESSPKRRPETQRSPAGNCPVTLWWAGNVSYGLSSTLADQHIIWILDRCPLSLLVSKT